MTEPRSNAVRSLSIRSFLRATLEKSWRWAVVTFWIAAFLAFGAGYFWPVLISAAQGSNDNPDARFGQLLAKEKAGVDQATEVESKRIAEMSLLREPLRPAPPPPQAAPAIPSPALFGLPKDQAEEFNLMTAGLAKTAGACTGWLGAAPAQDASTPPEIDEANATLNAISGGASKDRGVIHYHMGVAALCSDSAAGAVKEFEIAEAAYKSYEADQGSPHSQDDLRRLAQYRTVTAYGLGLALMAEGEDALNKADAAFAAALDAAPQGVASHVQGPFIAYDRSRCGGKRAPCDLFAFSTAEIYNARLHLWLSHDKPARAYAVAAELARWPNLVARDPGLAANFAAAAAATGNFTAIQRLYSVVKDQLESGGPLAAQWKGSPALARLAAMAAISSPEQVYLPGYGWWPEATPTPTRNLFAKNNYSRDEDWFPSLALEDPADQAAVDLWLWIRRERLLLKNGKFTDFRMDGTAIASLSPGDRDILERWRQAITQRLGDNLLKRAEKVRELSGLKAAAPLLQLISGPEFPWTVRARAHLSLIYDAPPEEVVIHGLVGLAAILALAFIHLNLGVGYGRTFTRRHYEHRVLQTGAAP